MGKVLKDQEVAAVSAGADRYAHFVGQVTDWEEVWGLKGPDGWVLAADDGGRQMMPVWPHARYAEACAIGEWAGSTPEAIPLDRWLEGWLPGMTRDGVGVAVFPVPNGVGVPVAPQQLAQDLSEGTDQDE